MTESMQSHPEQALFASDAAPPVLYSCEHIAGTPRFLQKAIALRQSLGKDFDITCDLEDGSPVDNLIEHAGELIQVLTSTPPQHATVGLRLPHHSSEHWRSLLTLFVENAGHLLCYVTVPKIDSLNEVESISTSLRAQELACSIERPIPLHVLIETPKALLNIDAIASHQRVECLDFGIMDFISEHLGGIPAHCMHSPGQFENELVRQAKVTIARAAYAHGCVASHNVTTAFNDAKQTFEDAAIAREKFGFSRMWSIHPNQIEPIINAMTPDFSTISRSQIIIQRGADSGWRPLALDGTLYDRASYRFHWQLCKQARLAGHLLDTEFEKRFFPD